MTGLASDCGMLAGERESEFGMIHLGQSPTFGRVTGGAIRPKGAHVTVILRMAGEAILRRAFEDTVLMAGGTGYAGMFSR